MQSGYVIALTSTATEDQARAMARSIVEQKLAACVHIDAIHSIYRWQGKLHEDPEWRLVIKTTSERYAALEQHIQAQHSYQTPEIIRIDITGGSAEYLKWIDGSL